MSGPNHIDVVLYGYRTIQSDGVEVAQRGVLNIVGATISDNAGTGATDLVIDAASIGATVEGKEDTIALRASDGGLHAIGESTFEALTATDLHGDSITVTGDAQAAAHTLSADVTETRAVLGGAASPSAGWVPLTGRKWTNATVGGVVEYDLEAPDGCELVSLTATVTPAGAHVGMPAGAARLQLLTIDVDGTILDTQTQTDTSADLTAYQQTHEIVLDLDDMPWDSSTGQRLVVVVQAESSTNSLTGTVLEGLRYKRTRPAGAKIGQD